MELCCPIVWQDWCELIVLTVGIYKVHIWLVTDTRLPLLTWLYMYGCIIFVIYGGHFATLMPLVPISTPIILMLIMLLHKNSLQRDMVPYKHHPATVVNDHDWLVEIMRSALVSINENRTVTVLFEYTDDIEPFIVTPYTLRTRVQQELLHLLLNQALYQHNEMLWVTHMGTIITNKATWLLPISEKCTQEIDSDRLSNLRYLSMLYSAKINCLVCIVNQTTRTATIIVHGTQFDMLPMQETYAIIAKHLGIRTASSTFYKVSHETYTNSLWKQSTR